MAIKHLNLCQLLNEDICIQTLLHLKISSEICPKYTIFKVCVPYNVMLSCYNSDQGVYMKPCVGPARSDFVPRPRLSTAGGKWPCMPGTMLRI